MRVHGDQVHGDATGVEVEGADGLDRIAVQFHASVTADRADLGDRLDGADLVVRVHHRYERRFRLDRGRDRGRIDATVTTHGHDRDAHLAPRFEIPRGIEHRMMLDRGGDEVIAEAAARLHHTT